MRLILGRTGRTWQMSNNLTNSTLKPRLIAFHGKLKTGLLCGLSLMVLASCAPEDLNGGKNASAKKNGNNGVVRPQQNAQCRPTPEHPCPSTSTQVTVQGDIAPFSESSLGFFETNDNAIPEAVRSAKSGVVKLIIPKGNAQTNKEILKLITNNAEEQEISNEDLITKLREEIERAQEQSKKDELQGLLVQVEQCKQKNDNTCKIMKDIDVQSGFVIRDKKNVVTTLDSIVEYLKQKHDLTSDEKIKDSINIRTLLQSTEIPMLIINAEGKILSGAEKKIKVAVDTQMAVSDKIMYKLKNDSRYKAFHNTIALRTEVDVESTLIKTPQANIQLQNTDELYVIGFPHESKSRERNNANGKDVFITKGKLAQVQSVKTALGLDIQIDQADESNFLGLSNDSNLGLEGAALMNKDGEFIALAAYSKAESDSVQNRATLSIKLPSLTAAVANGTPRRSTTPAGTSNENASTTTAEQNAPATTQPETAVESTDLNQ